MAEGNKSARNIHNMTQTALASAVECSKDQTRPGQGT